MPQKLAVYKYRSQNNITYTFQLQIWYTCGLAANTRGAESYNAARRNQILIHQKKQLAVPWQQRNRCCSHNEALSDHIHTQSADTNLKMLTEIQNNNIPRPQSAGAELN